MTHIESRPSKTNAGLYYDFYVDCSVIESEQMDQLLSKLNKTAINVSVHSRSPEKNESKCLIGSQRV